MAELTHSKKFDTVKRYYHAGVWTRKMVWNAVGRWITADEYQEITGEPYVVEETVTEG
ncbi:MAG: XkdX family protein [Lachnospiraceae bacterium]|nr:XkdX family protein [Lachnospiraceae bacterium]